VDSLAGDCGGGGVFGDGAGRGDGYGHFLRGILAEAQGKYLLQVCRSLSCELCGSKPITDHIRKKLGIEVGETTNDGKFTLVELECLGACGNAAVALVNDVMYEDLTTENLDRALDALPEDPHHFKDPVVTWEK